MKKKLSIIVPVFNGENEITNCILSLYNEKLKNLYEIIVVNDGSTDNTLSVLKELQKKIINMKIIDEINHGVSFARNVGVRNASGIYISFCDHDDQYELNLVEKILNMIKDFDDDLIIFSRLDIENETVISNYKINFSNEKYDDYLLNLFSTGKVTYSVCNKVFKKSIIDKHLILFDDKLVYSEDTLFNLIYSLYVNSIGFIDGNYKRICKNGSAIYKNVDNFFFKNIHVIEMFRQYVALNNINISKKIYINLYEHYLYVSICRVVDFIDCPKIFEAYFYLNKLFFFARKNNLHLYKGVGKKRVLTYYCFKFHFLFFIIIVLRNISREVIMYEKNKCFNFIW